MTRKRGSKPGKPLAPIDWDLVDRLLMAGCKGTEVAARVGIHSDTLYRRVEQQYDVLFTDYAAKLKEKGNTFLREAQMTNALSGNTTMQVWLGKQRLEQRENPEDKYDPATVNQFMELMNQLSRLQRQDRNDSISD